MYSYSRHESPTRSSMRSPRRGSSPFRQSVNTFIPDVPSRSFSPGRSRDMLSSVPRGTIASLRHSADQMRRSTAMSSLNVTPPQNVYSPADLRPYRISPSRNLSSSYSEALAPISPHDARSLEEAILRTEQCNHEASLGHYGHSHTMLDASQSDFRRTLNSIPKQSITAFTSSYRSASANLTPSQRCSPFRETRDPRPSYEEKHRSVERTFTTIPSTTRNGDAVRWHHENNYLYRPSKPVGHSHHNKLSQTAPVARNARLFTHLDHSQYFPGLMSPPNVRQHNSMRLDRSRSRSLLNSRDVSPNRYETVSVRHARVNQKSLIGKSLLSNGRSRSSSPHYHSVYTVANPVQYSVNRLDHSQLMRSTSSAGLSGSIVCCGPVDLERDVKPYEYVEEHESVQKIRQPVSFGHFGPTLSPLDYRSPNSPFRGHSLHGLESATLGGSYRR